MLNEIIKKRISPRAFASIIPGEEQIHCLFEAARRAPSSRNEQPWRFIYATIDNKENHQKILEVLNDSNKLWAKNAPLLILTAAKLDSGLTGGQINRYAFHDVGLAVANLTFQANAYDMFVHQIGGFNTEKARILFDLPENFEPVSVLAVGYKGDPGTLPENLKLRENAPRIRKELSEIVFAGKFGEAGNLTKSVHHRI